MNQNDGLDIYGEDPFGRNLLYGLSSERDGLGLQPPAQGLLVDTRPSDRMQATPRGFISGLFSDVLDQTLNMPALPRTGIPSLDLLYANRNPIFKTMGIGDLQKTAERISYGEPLTTGSGMTLKPREETIGAAMTVAPFVGEAMNFGARAGRTGARMIGQSIAENMAMGKPNLPGLLAEPRSSLFAVEPSPMMPKPQAPVSELGFYSATEQAAMNLPRNKGTGQSFLNDLMKAPDVKKDELAWTGLDDFLKDKPNVTKQEVQDYLVNNRVDLQEVKMGEAVTEDPAGIARRKAVFDKYEPEIQDLYRRIDKPEYVTYDQETNQVLKSYKNYEDALWDNLNPEIAFGKSKTGLRPKENSRELQQKITDLQNIRDAEADAVYVVPEPVPTKYGRYQLPGGQNYREILLKMPSKPQALPEGFTVDAYSVNGQTKYGVYDAAGQRYGSGETKEEALQRFSDLHEPSTYKSSHWKDPNVLAHMRVNDRVDADGKKMLLVEEIQSDWHQAGREKGYKSSDLEKRIKDTNQKIYDLDTRRSSLLNQARDMTTHGPEFTNIMAEANDLSPKIMQLNDELVAYQKIKKGGVPDAPFKDTWYQLALKRIMKYAADNGYERVGLTTGKQQADRYQMSNEVNTLAWREPGGGVKKEVTIDLVDGDNMTLSVDNEGKLMGGQFDGKSLNSVVGKDLSKKIMSENSGNLSGNGLNIGGEGMKAYYDEIYPKYLEKYGKKWDAKVGNTYVNTGKVQSKDELAQQVYGAGIDYAYLPSEQKRKIDVMFMDMNKDESIRYIDITPKMKEGVSKGQPLFAAAPLAPLGLLDTEQENTQMTIQPTLNKPQSAGLLSP